jgi:hypothetical protein
VLVEKKFEFSRVKLKMQTRSSKILIFDRVAK